ncbi:MAG: hypothetical protein ACLRWO_13160 [Clostridium butyricum]
MKDKILKYLKSQGDRMTRNQAISEIKRSLGYAENQIRPIYEAWRKEYVAI